MTATHETILEQLVLDGGDPLTLPPGDTPWCVSRGKIEVYLLSAARRRLVIVVGAGEHVFPLPAGSDLSLILLAPEGAVIAPSEAADAIAASAQLWLGGADDEARDETPIRAVQNYLLALDAKHARADAERDATDLARLARQDPGAGVAAAPDGGLRDALATIAAAFRLPGARSPAPVSQAADFSAVPQLARAMGFRARQVTLPWAWPRDNLGPLIIVRIADGAIGEADNKIGEADNKIVALLWRGGRYVGPDGPVDDEGAARYEGWAYVAHAPLSPRVVDLFSLGRQVLGGAAEEMPWIVACGLGVALVGLIVPLATGWLFEDIVPSGQGGLLMAVGIALIAAAIVQLVLGAARGLAQARIEGPSSVQLAAGLTDRLLKLPTRFFKTLSAGDLNQRIQAVETMRALVVGVVLSSGVTAVFSIIYLGLLFSYDARLALIALGVALVYVAALLFSRLLQIAPLREAAAIDGRISGLVYETLEGIAKLRTAAAERRALARWRGLYVKEQEVSVRGDRIAGQFETFADVWQIVALAGLFAVAALLRDHGMNAALFIGFLAGYAIFQSSFVTFCEAVLRLLAAQPLAERARVLLTAETEGKVGSADPGRLTGLIEVSGVSFGYTADGPPLLSQLSFTLMPGEHIAIVGGSGSGKSTVLRLLLGFEAARTGAVFYDGQDLAALDPARVRQQIGVVLQSSRLFAGTILENIRGSGDLSLEQCLRAADLAGLARDLELLPMGLHTAITEGAGTLSGGQRQRILIARAIASEPRILFLDEATSALDNVTQAVVAKTIDSMKVSRVTIAHRLSTVRNADKICVLVDGRFVETGNYRELIARGGAFAELAQRQLLED